MSDHGVIIAGPDRYRHIAELSLTQIKAATLRSAATALPAPRSALGGPLARARQP